MIAERTWNHTGLDRSARAVRTLMIFSLTHCALASCTSEETPPVQQGPVFVINSPAEGASVSGATFFSVQPFDPAQVQSVSFTAGGRQLSPTAPGEDTFKVFLIPRDFPDGTLTLRATVIGTDGGESERSIDVQVVANPPSSATVTEDGAILGTTEESGALSTMSIPAGVAEGAVVSFSARTKDEVKAATGIDYDALGVTFLGAQEIGSDHPLDGPVGVSSGGFGPMVQPGQAVLNYTIVPDGDGDGIGELVAVNIASVAPSDEVVSNPVPQIILDPAAATTTVRSRTASSAQAATLGGPPGTSIELEATGFNPFSPFGNVASFKSLVDDTEVEMPMIVNGHFEEPDAVPTISFYIPVLPPGAATVTLRNVSSGATAAPLTVTVETPPALTKDPAVIIDDALTEGIRVLAKTPGSDDMVARLQDVQSRFAELGLQATPEDAELLSNAAVFISNSNMGDILSRIEATSGSSFADMQARSGLQAGAGCSQQDFLVFTGLGAYGILLSSIALGASVALFPVSFVAAAVLATTGVAAIAPLLLAVEGLVLCASTPQANCPAPPSLEGLLTTPGLPPSGGLAPAAIAPPNPVTGMGSIIPPGGQGCGSVAGDNPFASAGLRSSGPRARSASPSSLPGDLSSRFVIKVFFGGGSSVPFSGVTDSSGYFYIPTIPAGQPFQAIAFDTVTGKTRSVTGVGPEVGRSTYLPFDFSTGENSGATVIAYDSNTQAAYGDVDIYAFEGRAGDFINVAVFSEAVLPEVLFQLSDPNGVPLHTGSLSGGHFFQLDFDQFLQELPSDGLYGFSLDGTNGQGSYTLGLTRIEPIDTDVTAPIAAELDTIGEKRFYRFTGSAGDVLTITLSAPVLNARLQLRAPQPGGPFYSQLPILLKLFTFDTQRESSASVTLTVDGEYVLELSHEDNPFDADMQRYLGAFEIDIVRTR